MKHASLAIPAALALATAVSGCMNERTYVDPSQNVAVAGGGSQLSVKGGHLRGDIGSIRGFDQPASKIDAYNDTEWQTANVTVQADKENRDVGMLILNLSDRSLDALPVGVTTFGVDNPNISVLGCSGTDGEIAYDQPADQGGTITVTPTPEGDREIVVAGTWTPTDAEGNPVDGEPLNATGSFVYTP